MKDGVIDQTGTITDVPREPDAIARTGNTRLATANEGDWKGGTRGWTIFDTSGRVRWDSGNSLGRLAVQYGLHNEDRAAKKGAAWPSIRSATKVGVPIGWSALWALSAKPGSSTTPGLGELLPMAPRARRRADCLHRCGRPGRVGRSTEGER